MKSLSAARLILFEVLETGDGPQDAAMASLTPGELAELFTLSSLLVAALPVLEEYRWLKKGAALDAFFDAAFLRELRPLSFLKPNLIRQRRTAKEIRALVGLAASVATRSIPDRSSGGRFFSFCALALEEISTLMRHELSLHENFLANALDRAFDGIDQIFGVEFSGEKNFHAQGLDESLPANGERSFAGAGVGVQSSYASLLRSLEKLAPLTGARLIDLGSGYGRAGLVIGLLRPDMHFIGYEYVEHRTLVAEACATRLGLSKQIQFITQDLADPAFQIPLADIYYLYDPFTEETYRSVLAQLRSLGKNNVVTVATRGHATVWVAEVLNGIGWSVETGADEGLLSLFTSRPTNDARALLAAAR